MLSFLDSMLYFVSKYRSLYSFLDSMLYFVSNYRSRLLTRDVLNVAIPAWSLIAVYNVYQHGQQHLPREIKQVSPSPSLVEMKAGFNIARIFIRSSQFM